MDSEGTTTKKALNDMGYDVGGVSTAKVYEIELEAPTPQEAEELADDMCRKLLANPVKDDYEVEVKESE